MGLPLVVIGLICLAANSFAAETRAPDTLTTTTNVLLPGTSFATECYVRDSGAPGPTVMIVGGVHGNEPAGARAAEVILGWPIKKGKVILIPRANVPGLAANKRLIPNLDTNLSNLNRNYPRAGKDEPARGEIAENIWDIALKYKPDCLLDLHEGYDFHQLNDKSTGSSVICFPLQKGQELADAMLANVNSTITNTEFKFVRRNMPIDGSLARAGGEHLNIPSMTVETTSKQPMAKRVHQQEILVHTVFSKLGMMDNNLPPETFVAAPEPAHNHEANEANEPHKQLRVALYKGPGTGGEGPPNLMARLNHAPESSITEVSPEEIRADVLGNFDVVIFAGGSGSKQAEALGEAGRAAVQKFVGNGGGYIGICGGSFLALSGYPWSLGIINAKTVSPKWQRGKATVKLELTPTGKPILGARPGLFDCLYHNGPIVKADDKTNLPPFSTLAFFRTEIAEHDSPAGVMVGAPAVFSGTYKHGQVICISPHPEQTKGLEDIVPHAVTWVSPKEKAEFSKETE